MQVLSSDLLRGHIDAFVLSALMKGEKYGAEIKNCIAKKSKNIYKKSTNINYFWLKKSTVKQ